MTRKYRCHFKHVTRGSRPRAAWPNKTARPPYRRPGCGLSLRRLSRSHCLDISVSAQQCDYLRSRWRLSRLTLSIRQPAGSRRSMKYTTSLATLNIVQLTTSFQNRVWGGSTTMPWTAGRPRLSIVPALGHDPLQFIIRALFHQQLRKDFLKPQTGALKCPSKQDDIMTYVKHEIIVFYQKIASMDFTKMRIRTSLLANQSF
jgi:hypothetical protein